MVSSCTLIATAASSAGRAFTKRSRAAGHILRRSSRRTASGPSAASKTPVSGVGPSSGKPLAMRCQRETSGCP
eukprot:7538592-Alexandrium_andersonii.AAC.1